MIPSQYLENPEFVALCEEISKHARGLDDALQELQKKFPAPTSTWTYRHYWDYARPDYNVVCRRDFNCDVYD